MTRLARAFALAATAVFVAAFSLAASAAPQAAQKAPLPAPDKSDILVQLAPGAGGPALQAQLPAGDDLTAVAPQRGIYRLQSSASPEATLARLRGSAAVAYAEPNRPIRIAASPNDPDYTAMQWALGVINAPQAWDIVTGTTPITIAIIDTGIDLNHPDLRDKLVTGTSFVTGAYSAQDDHGHGTHVAGIAAASTNNGIGMAGVSWGARLMPVKVLDSSGAGTYAELINGIYYAAHHGAQILNMSLTGEWYSPLVQQAIDDAYDAGCLLIAAAGNCAQGGSGCASLNPVMYPAANARVLSVAATDELDRRAAFSSYNAFVDVAAPGVGIYSTSWQGGVSTYAWLHGTSQAAPHVAGLAALIWSGRPSVSNADVERIIQATAQDVNAATAPGRDAFVGWGRINAYRAVDRTPPISAVLPLPAAQREPAFTVAWSGTDENSGVSSYTVQYRDGNGPWFTWRLGVTATSDTFVGSEGHTYYFRSSATDVAGNVEPYAAGDGDASITISTCSLEGTVRDNRGITVAGATVTLLPEGTSTTTGHTGAYTLAPADCLAPHSIAATRSGFGELPAMTGVVGGATGALAGLDLYVPPADNVLASLNWGFEWGTLAPPWTASGTPAPSVGPGAGHTGAHALSLGTPMTATSPGGVSAVAVTVTIPVTLYQPVLSFMYRVQTMDNSSHDYFAVWLNGQRLFTDGYDGADFGTARDLGWRHGWLDLSGYAGQSVTVSLGVVQGQAYAAYPTQALLDEVSIGSSSGGVYRSRLPVIIAGY